MRLLKTILIASSCTWLACGRSSAVMLYENGDPAHNSSTPGDNSGWQFEGKFNFFLGVPIAPHFFITAAHIGGTIGNPLDLHGDLYITIGFQDIPDTDLRVWEVQHTKPFPTYAPISNGLGEVGALVTVFGRGTQRGAEVLNASNQLRGWAWGPGDGVKRWGRNMIINPSVSLTTEFLVCHFDELGVPDECHLSVGDSGGGMFLLQDGLWRLAGIHYAVDGPFRVIPEGPSFSGAIFNRDGLEIFDGTDWTDVPRNSFDVKSSFYSSRVASSLPWLTQNVGPEVNSLAPESYPAWQKLYFSPAQIADSSISGPTEDPDGDGVGNLTEYALNLDPTFNEELVMTAGTGLRGLPLTRYENDRLTIEFVRRTAASGANLTYFPEFSDDLVTWTASGTEISSNLNSRWQRVKITDSATTNSARFVRLRIIHTP